MENQTSKRRSNQQNKSLHKYCEQMANECVAHGLTTAVILQNLQVYPTMESIKDILRQIGKVKFQKESTADWTSQELQAVFTEFYQHMIEITNGTIDIPWPSLENSNEYLQALEQSL